MPWKQFTEIIENKTKQTKGKARDQKKLMPGWLIFVLIILFLLIIGLASAMAGYNVYFQNKIFPGISVNGLNLGGKTSGQAIALLQAKIDQLNSQGIIFKFNQHQFTLKRIVSGGDGALAFE